MKFTIECSYGEIIDKITILQIKLKKTTDARQTQNITNEYNALKGHIKPNDENELQFTELFDELVKINNKLWILEDVIRLKSHKQEFDSSYIKCAENIHTTNDERYLIKKKINELYDSEIIEEKIYNTFAPVATATSTTTTEQPITTIKSSDEILFHKSMSQFNNGEFVATHTNLNTLCKKFSSIATNPLNAKIVRNFVSDVFISYDIVSLTLGLKNEYVNVFHHIMQNQNILNYISLEPKILHAKKMYGIMLLQQKQYSSSANYTKYLQPVSNPSLSISPDSMSCFGANDVNKTLLVYMSGGIGDKIMHSRFLSKFADVHARNNNSIIFLVDDCLFWMYDNLYKTCTNIIVVKYCEKQIISSFDHHVNLTMLFQYLKLDYDDIYVDYYLQHYQPNQHKRSATVIAHNFKNCVDKNRHGKKLNVIINWHGNLENSHEKHNRGMSLNTLIPLFANKNNLINWISVQKETSFLEKKLLTKYGVHNVGEMCDNDGDAFNDTIALLKTVDVVISTDTSLIHVAGTANAKCWCLLTVGPDWRWTQHDKTTKWYPNMKLFRQKNVSDWSNVIDDVQSELSLMLKPE